MLKAYKTAKNLGDYDIDEQMPQHIDTHCFSLQELSKSFYKSASNKELSIFHSNIRSLSLHLDELLGLAMNLNQSFDVIGVSETSDSFENPIATNVEIPGMILSSLGLTARMVVLGCMLNPICQPYQGRILLQE